MPVRGQELVARNIREYGGGFLKLVNKQMKEVAKLMDKQVTKNASATDHSIQSLRNLDHPYSRRNTQSIHTPDFTVHKQSGNLLKSKRSGIKDANISLGSLRASAFVGFDEKVAPHALHIIYGTSKMIPRDVLSGSVDQIQGKAINLLKRKIKGFNFSFRGVRQ